MSQLSVAKQNNIEGKIEEFIYSLANLSAKKNAFFATKYWRSAKKTTYINTFIFISIMFQGQML